MDTPLSRKLKAFMIYSYRQAWRRRSFWMRMTLAWVIAVAFAIFNKDMNADQRFAIRPPQEIASDIVLVELDQSDWPRLINKQASTASLFKESNPFNDSYFWHEKTWEVLLKNILNQSPERIGVTFFFGENSPQPSLGARNKMSFGHPKIIWGVQTNQEGDILPSYFAGSLTRNAGLLDIPLDGDGLARRITFTSKTAATLAQQLLYKSAYDNGQLNKVRDNKNLLINFRGPHGTFPTVKASDVVLSKVPSSFFKNKIVLIGPSAKSHFSVKTPVGLLSRAEYQANIIDNLQEERWITIFPLPLLLILLAALIWLSALITSNYPQFLAFAVIIMGQTLVIATSYFLFDTFYLYLAILPVSVALLGTYMIFLSFQLSIRDYENVRLEKEKQFLVNVEELKNNFFSLISHDLKTPIAKIQGICDRMLARNPDEEFSNDIEALKTEARELNRYIKTLLQLTRVESKDFKVNREPLDLNEIIEQVIEIVRPLARNKNILLTRKLEPMFLIEADPLLMTEVVLNLLENAIKYSPENSEVSISSHEVDGRVIVLVEDHGPGISPEDQKFVFERFYRGQEGLNHSKGSGLGLYLVKYFIERHEGFVLLESNLGVGTKIGFSVPVQMDAQEAEEPQETDNLGVENETSA